MKKTFLIFIALFFAVNLFANEAALEKCEETYTSCAEKCENVQDDKQSECYEKCDKSYEKCLEEVQSK
jgi:hypothetical protein